MNEIEEAEEMEVPAWVFISFWAVISITSLHLGFRALDKTELSHSVSPFVMLLFKQSLAISSSFSSTYALKFRSQSSFTVRSNYVLLFYALVAAIFPKTIEGILIWRALNAIFTCLVYFLGKLKVFLATIFRIPASFLIPIFGFVWRKILPISGIVILLPLVLQCMSSDSSPSSLVVPIVSALIGFVVQSIYTYTLARLFSATAFLWAPIFTFLFYLFCLWLFFVLAYGLFLILKEILLERRTRSAILFALETSLFFASANKTDFFPVVVLSISHFMCVVWAKLPRFGDYTIVSTDPNSAESEGLEGLVNVGVRFVGVKMKGVVWMLKEHKAKKFIEFAVGTVGAILFQNFFRITSFSEVAAFLYLAVMWLANLVLLDFCGDFGVFNFMLGNVVVGCTVGQFGLQGTTWAALGAALLLFGLRLKLESLHMVYGEGQPIQLPYFGHHQQSHS